MDRLDELEIFVAVVETGCLRGAGLRLRRSGSTVTRAVASLEARLSRRPLDRTTRRLAVTAAGKETYEAALGLISGWKDLATVPLSAPVRGLVRVTAPVVFGRLFVAPAIGGFLTRWPEAAIDLQLDDDYLDLVEHGLDAAVRLGRLPDSSLVAQRVGAVRWLLLASPRYLAEHGFLNSPADLADHATIAEPARSGRPSWSFARGKETQTVALAPRIQSNDITVQLQAARDGHGITRALTYHAAAHLRDGTLVRILRNFEPEEIPVQVVSSGGRRKDGKTRAIVEHLVSHLRPALLEMRSDG